MIHTHGHVAMGMYPFMSELEVGRSHNKFSVSHDNGS